MMSVVSIDERALPIFLKLMRLQFYVASLQSGATVVAFDGSPLKPIGALWTLVDQLK